MVKPTAEEVLRRETIYRIRRQVRDWAQRELDEADKNLRRAYEDRGDESSSGEKVVVIESSRSVIDGVLAPHGYTLEDVRSHARHDSRLNRLRIAVYRALLKAGYSTSHTGRLTNRDHSTILYHRSKGRLA